MTTEPEAPFPGFRRRLRFHRGGRHGSDMPRFNRLPVRSLAPNILTTLALCSGLTAIRFAIDEKFVLAVAAIFVAAVLDGLDGRLARMLKGTSRFGAELDSLADFLSFGVAPIVVLYLWSLETLSGLGWIAVLSYAVCCALRLARFNVAVEDPDRPAWTSQFFIGVPSPAAAALVLLPLVGSFALGYEQFRSPWVVTPLVITVAVLMVSRLPTFSLKRIGIHRDLVLPTLVFAGMGAALLLSYPWEVIGVVTCVYAASLPFGLLAWRRAWAAFELRTREPADTDDDL